MYFEECWWPNTFCLCWHPLYFLSIQCYQHSLKYLVFYRRKLVWKDMGVNKCWKNWVDFPFKWSTKNKPLDGPWGFSSQSEYGACPNTWGRSWSSACDRKDKHKTVPRRINAKAKTTLTKSALVQFLRLSVSNYTSCAWTREENSVSYII